MKGFVVAALVAPLLVAAPAGATEMKGRPTPVPKVAAPRAVPPADLPPADDSPVFPRLAHPPLPGRLVLSGSFGEHRSSHLHAGLDFSIGGVVGMEVYASEPGVIERVRAAGAGYGRSLYLRADDGRLLVYAHLDAFDEPMASYIAEVQETTGQYEQDLYPERGFRVKAGDRIGWGGRSGTGSPHLHFEVRRGDMAINPVRGGLPVPDGFAPVIRAVTFEPLDERSFVAGAQAPLTVTPGTAPDTVVLMGRARVVVDAVDRGERRATMAPWGVGIEWEGMRYEWRADSISWATDPAEVDYDYDLGRAAPWSKTTLRMWAAAGARPRMAVTTVPESADAGVIRAAPGDPPRPLHVYARDLAGHRTRRTVWVRGPAGPAEEGGVGGALVGEEERLAFAPLPNARLRFAPRGGGRRSAAILPVAPGENPLGAGTLRGWTVQPVASGAIEGFASWTVAAGATWEPAGWAVRREDRVAGAPAELRPVSAALAMLPVRPPLRAPLVLRLPLPDSLKDRPRLAVFREGEEGWDFESAALDGDGFRIETRRLGRFAVFEDTAGPRITPLAAPRTPSRRGPYSSWALGARLADGGSGVHARNSHFVVDGRRVPSEWDGVRGELRWRPRRAPAPGTHRYEVVAADRAGNVTRRAGTFVIE